MAQRSYYLTLELTKSAQANDINDAFRRLAMKYHPAKSSAEGAAAMFSSVAEAYTVLSDAKLRAVFDQYGYKGLTAGAPMGQTGFTEPWAFHGDADAVFRDFFGTDNPYQDIFPPNDEFGLGAAAGMGTRTRRKQDPPIENPLFLTLEEAYTGCVKKMKVTRQVLNQDGHTSAAKDKILTVNVKPGWKEGTRVTFPNDGDQGPNIIPADIVFVVKYRDHPRFVREGNNLVHTATVSLGDALAGCLVELLTLDSRKLSIPINDVVTPVYEKVIEGEGMPVTKSPSAKGSLVLRFTILYPSSLNDDQKALVRQALG